LVPKKKNQEMMIIMEDMLMVKVKEVVEELRTNMISQVLKQDSKKNPFTKTGLTGLPKKKMIDPQEIKITDLQEIETKSLDLKKVRKSM